MEELEEVRIIFISPLPNIVVSVSGARIDLSRRIESVEGSTNGKRTSFVGAPPHLCWKFIIEANFLFPVDMSRQSGKRLC